MHTHFNLTNVHHFISLAGLPLYSSSLLTHRITSIMRKFFYFLLQGLICTESFEVGEVKCILKDLAVDKTVQAGHDVTFVIHQIVSMMSSAWLNWWRAANHFSHWHLLWIQKTTIERRLLWRGSFWIFPSDEVSDKLLQKWIKNLSLTVQSKA